jgi:hypothetical protein
MGSHLRTHGEPPSATARSRQETPQRRTFYCFEMRGILPYSLGLVLWKAEVAGSSSIEIEGRKPQEK